MKKVQQQKLSLCRETVQSLTLPERRVVGGYTNLCTDDTCATTNGTGCDTRGTCGTMYC